MMTPEEYRNYRAYAKGNRSVEARAGKAAYMRELRAAKKAEAVGLGDTPVVGIKHGLSGYQNHYCRCAVCKAAKRGADQKPSP